jgi:excisionase family DNA binding protein
MPKKKEPKTKEEERPEDLLTLQEVADLLNRSVRTIRRYIQDGKLPAQMLPGRFGGEYRVTRGDAQSLLTEPSQQREPRKITFAVCTATRADGKPCRAPAWHGTPYCRHHQPANRINDEEPPAAE